MQEQAPGDEGIEQPWLLPHEYEIGGVRWFSDTVHELQRALHPLLAQIPRVELADAPTRPPEGAPLPPEASSLYRPTAVAHEWTISLEDIVAFRVEQLLADIYALADNEGASRRSPCRRALRPLGGPARPA